MKIGFKVRIYPNKEQALKIDNIVLKRYNICKADVISIFKN